MTFTLAVAAGTEAVDELRRSRGEQIRLGQVEWVRSGPHVVAWDARCPWIDVADDGDVLVVIDGRLHEPVSASGDAIFIQRRYGRAGAAVARDLLGDFVAVILDRSRQRLVVARDPVGVRPWYHSTAGRRHTGASDVATLASLDWVDTSLNEHVAIEYLATITESRGETFHRGIRTLGPGSTWQSAGGVFHTFEHHTWQLEPELDLSWDDAAARCRSVLDTAVRSRLGGGGRATSELSGGLDSSSVVGTAVLLGHDDLLVGRLLFEGPQADERAYSDAVIERWGLEAISVPPWLPSAEECEDLGRVLQRPVPDPHFTMFSTLQRALVAAGGARGLTGAGGDDAFVAMRTGAMVVSAVKLRQRRVLADLARRTLGAPRQAGPALVRPTLGYLAEPWRTPKIGAWVSDAAAAAAQLSDRLRRRPERVTGIDAIDERLDGLTSGFMAAIFETRALVADETGKRDSHPFLDPRFVSATYGLDPWWPVRGGHYRALEAHAFRDRLPSLVADRLTKAGFAEVFWPALLDDQVTGRVRTGALAQLGWLDGDGFDTLVENAKRGMANAAIPLARCVLLDQWISRG